MKVKAELVYTVDYGAEWNLNTGKEHDYVVGVGVSIEEAKMDLALIIAEKNGLESFEEVEIEIID